MSVGPSPARSEPLLWLQLIGLGVLPLEALLLLLLLAGTDPGPLPGLERLLCWALGGLAPALVLWRRPADVWSLLLLQAPLRARREVQQRLSRLQQPSPGLSLGLGAGALLLLALLWWVDRHAAVAGPFALLATAPRLVDLLLSSALLALMLWQWQQLLQAIWLLGRSDEAIAAAAPLSQTALEQSRLSLGLPLLLLAPLTPSLPGAAPAGPRQTPDSVAAAVGAAAVTAAVAVEPEQAAEQEQGADLDQQIG